MKFLFTLTNAFLISSLLFGQTELSGIINSYAKVAQIDPCASRLTLNGIFDLAIGDTVFLIQMQGATINETNSDSYGKVTELGSAGLFEKNVVDSIVGQDVFLKYMLVNNFDVAGSLQLVSFPVFENAVVVDTVKALPWNGEIGGIILFGVKDKLILHAPIDASGAGFRGGDTQTHSSDCNFFTNADAYHYDLSNWRGAPKGEGIAKKIAGKEQGRGPQGNGGGGGNDHNSGGGGGSHISIGGDGGRTSTAGLGCDGDYPGSGGIGLPLIENRWYMGGGGGAGHDNNGFGTSGGAGGGIVLVFADKIQANGNRIKANGLHALKADFDGAGGGGAGGTVVLQSNEIMGDLLVETFGGNGGDVGNASDRCFGTGGGGSGGRLVADPIIGLVFLSNGGLAGENQTVSSQCNDPKNGAENGSIGLQTAFLEIPFSDEEQLPTAILQNPDSLVICEMGNASFEVHAQGTNLQYQWQINDGNGWKDLSLNANATGSSTPTLSLINLDGSWHQALFRCLVFNSCSDSINSGVANLLVISPPVPFPFIINDLGGNEFSFAVPPPPPFNGTYTYLWDFGDGDTSIEPSPHHTFLDDGTYLVAVTISNECGQIVVTDTLTIGQTLGVLFSTSIDNPCAPATVQFTDQSIGMGIVSYDWQFEGGTPFFSNEPNPVIIYEQPGLFDVSLTVTNGAGDASTLSKPDLVDVLPVPSVAFSYSIQGDTVQFMDASSGADFWNWDFGDGNTSNEPSPLHIYGQEGVYQVTLTVSNMGCGASVSQEIMITPTSTEDALGVMKGLVIFPNPVQDILHIHFSEIPLSNTCLCLLDTNGRQLKTQFFTSEKMDLDTSSLASGFYFLRVISERGTALFRVIRI